MTNQTPECFGGYSETTSFVDRQLPDASIQAIETIARSASAHGIDAYLVGGMVRDIVARLPTVVTSPDVTIIGDAAQFARALAVENSDCSLISASQLHTAKFKIGSVAVDIASARTDIYEHMGSLPQIVLVNDVETDLHRRDFTVNAMAMRISSDGLGAVIDPFEGQRDVANKTMRAIRDDAFLEDPLRMMRGIRLAARYGYTFDSATAEQMRQSSHHLENMCDASPQRVFNEFRLWFQPYENLDDLTATATKHGILRVFFPSTDFQEGAFRNIAVDADEAERFAAFAYLASTDEMTNLVERLRMPSDWRAIVDEVGMVKRIAETLRRKPLSDVELRRALIDVRDAVVMAVIAVEPDPFISRRLIDFRDRLRPIRTTLKGDDIIELGIKRGPRVGQLLDELLDARTEGTISNADEERDYVIRRLADG